MNIGIKRKDIIRYTVFPELKPRIAELFISGFQQIPFFIALVYQTVRLLPPNHPYCDARNIGRFGIRHVIAEAANNLKLDRNNLDQIVLFACTLTGIVIVGLQLFLLLGAVVFSPAIAMPVNFLGFFVTPPANEAQDIANILMDMVFGVPDIFKSCISTPVPCQDMNGGSAALPGPFPLPIGPYSPLAYTVFPFAIHTAMHSMFQFYSFGLLVVAVFIASYFVITIIAETAQTGTPFGKRYNKVWAPIRFAVAFGLLVPMSLGLNTSQYIVLYAAKFGSGFATNGWNYFLSVLGANDLIDRYALVSQPNIPEMGTLLQFYYTARTCYYLEKLNEDPAKPRKIAPYLVGDPLSANPSEEVLPGYSYEQMIAFAQNGSTITPTSVTLRFGEYKPPTTKGGAADDYSYALHRGFVKPVCGEIRMNLTDPRVPGGANPPGPGPENLQRYYWFLLKELWYQNVGATPSNIPTINGPSMLPSILFNYPQIEARYPTQWDSLPPGTSKPGPDYKSALREFYECDLERVLTGVGACVVGPPPGVALNVLALQAASGQWDLLVLGQKGWAGAGIWYNRIAELNGAVTTAAFNIPTVSLYPEVMEYIRLKKRQQDQSTTITDLFKPYLSDDLDIPFQRPPDDQFAAALYSAFDYWQADGGLSSSHTEITGNIFIDAINLLLGTEGLFSMRKNTDVHPLAQLVGVGRSLIESSVRNMTGAGVAALFEPIFGKIAGVFSGFLITIAMVGLTVGFVLFYIVPFLPFIYFFFAVGGWVKGIFEAMVGAPLWALAHLRIDGNGLPGQAAANGYFLIFEIFIRPILIIFGLLASISVFSALVSVLNETFSLVTANLTGFDVKCEATGCGPSQANFYRAPLDEFFFTVIYAIIVYLMGMSSFKLIDLIPNNILRWMGSSVATFNDQREDPTQGMVGTATIGAQQTISGIGGSLKGFTKIGGKAGG